MSDSDSSGKIVWSRPLVTSQPGSSTSVHSGHLPDTLVSVAQTAPDVGSKANFSTTRGIRACAETPAQVHSPLPPAERPSHGRTVVYDSG